jgi:hypothetical protein
LGTASLGVQGFFAAATTTTAPITLKSSAATIPTGTNRKAGMMFFDGTSFFGHLTDNAAATDFLSASVPITSSVIPKGTGSGVVDGTWEFSGNTLLPTTTGSDIGVATTKLIKTIWGVEATFGQLAADTGALYLAHPDYFNVDDFALYQSGFDGQTYINSPLSIQFTVNGTIAEFEETKVRLAINPNQTVEIGNAIGSATGALIYTAGRGDTSATFNQDWANSSEVVLARMRDDGRFGVGTTTLTALINAGASTTSAASLNVSSGAAPTSPNNGDIWSESGVPKVRSNGVTKDIGAAPQIVGGVTLSSSSNTNILNGTYVILADTTAVSSVTSGVGQDSNWTLEVTQAGITNQKGVVAFTGNLEKDAGGGKNYDIAIFKNGSIVSESEQIDQKLESDGKGQSVTVMAIIEFSTNDTFDVRVAGNGTAEDIFCGGGSIYIN